MEYVVKKGENAQEVKYNKWAILFMFFTILKYLSCRLSINILSIFNISNLYFLK